MSGPPGTDGRLLLLGASARALAASAARSLETMRRFPGGLLAIDYFGDSDLGSDRPTPPGHTWPDVSVVSVSRDLGLPRAAPSLIRAALASRWSGFAYTGGLENHPGLVRHLARSRAGGPPAATILGNDAVTLAAVRDPRRLFPFLCDRGIPHAEVRQAPPPPEAGRWLVKRIRSAGGSGIRAPVQGEPPPPGWFFQKRLDGPIGSAAFLADGKEAILLGVTEQLAGWEALGASGYRYAGNIAGPSLAFLSVEALGLLARAAVEIAEGFGLRGLNGLDYVLHRDLPHLIEVNPRWTASMELIEERLECNLFDLHLQALDRACAGTFRMHAPEERQDSMGRFLAKGVLYAPGACAAPEPARLAALGARDRPPPGERIAAGHPICTLVVRGDSPAACRDLLEASAGEVRSLLFPA